MATTPATTPDLNQQVINKNIETATVQINNAFDALVGQKPKARLPEEVFTAHFLPYFSGDATNPAVQNRNVISEWIGVAGTPMTEVDVFDKKGEVIYTVPALFDTDMLEIAKHKPGNSISDVYAEYELRKVAVPIAANNFLNNALSEKSGNIVKENTAIQTASRRWENILKRYNLAPDTGANVEAKPADNDNGDDLVYE